MNEDRQLQAAIWNSIKTSAPARSSFNRSSLPSFVSAPRARPGNYRGKLFSDIADARVRSSFPSPPPRYGAPPPSASAGRRDVLLREGHRPLAPASGSAEPAKLSAPRPPVPRSTSERQPAPRKNEYLAAFKEYANAAEGERRSDAAAGAPRGGSGAPAPPRGTGPGTRNGVRAPLKLDNQPVQRLSDGWTLRTGRGNFAPGDPIRIEGLGPGFFFIAYDSAPECGALQTAPGFDLRFQVKALRTDTAESTHVSVVLSVPDSRFNGITGTSANFICLSMNASEKVWKAERYVDGGVQAMYGQAQDRSLAPNASASVEIKVRGRRVTLVSNGKPVFSDLEVPQVDALRGPVGLASWKTRLEVRGWSLAPQGAPGGPPAATASAAPAAPLVAAPAPRPPTPGTTTPPWWRPSSGRARTPFPSSVPPADPVLPQDILDRPLGVTFDDIAGLADAKRLLNEAVVLPLIIPEHFTGIREPWKGVLLFGPPGTGKTLLARAVASMGGTTFFACSAASLVSKWARPPRLPAPSPLPPRLPAPSPLPPRLPAPSPLPPASPPRALFPPPPRPSPLPPRLPAPSPLPPASPPEPSSPRLPARALFPPASPPRALFPPPPAPSPLPPASPPRALFPPPPARAARSGASRRSCPSVVFFDELDALASTRGAADEHEASRRFKSELLQQIDGVATAAAAGGAGGGGMVMVLATTNAPWDLDEAMRRRLEKRIYIPPPDPEARRAMFAIHLRSVPLDPSVSLEELAAATENYSGSDIRSVCRDASMAPVRRLAADKTPAEIRAMKGAGQLEVSLTRRDFEESLARTRPSIAPAELRRFEAWQAQFAST
eukprot:tig00020830_g14409.t1